jgi:NADPH:quinone reductase-like Zn-dependent oxidoreductase
MKAMLMTAVNQPFSSQAIDPQPGPGQVRIRLHATGVCGTDIVWESPGFRVVAADALTARRKRISFARRRRRGSVTEAATQSTW